MYTVVYSNYMSDPSKNLGHAITAWTFSPIAFLRDCPYAWCCQDKQCSCSFRSLCSIQLAKGPCTELETKSAWIIFKALFFHKIVGHIRSADVDS